jgi:biopolymer transport protein ExbD
MEKDASRGSRSTVVTLLVALIVVGVFASGLLVVGLGAYFVLQTQSRRSMIMAEQQQQLARQIQQQFELEQIRTQAERDMERLVEESSATTRDLVAESQASTVIQIALDADGQTRVDGTPKDREQLVQVVRGATATPGRGVQVQLRVSSRTSLASVTGILELCRTAGISDIRVTLQPRQD